MFVLKIMDVNMHADQVLLTLLNNVHRKDFPFGLKSSFHFFFLFSFLLVVSKNSTLSDGKEMVKFPEGAVH